MLVYFELTRSAANPKKSGAESTPLINDFRKVLVIRGSVAAGPCLPSRAAGIFLPSMDGNLGTGHSLMVLERSLRRCHHHLMRLCLQSGSCRFFGNRLCRDSH